MKSQRTGPEHWFLTDRQNPDTDLSLYTSGNRVVPLVDGAAYLSALGQLIATTERGDYVFIAGWRLDPDQVLDPELNHAGLFDALEQAWSRGVELRILLSGHRMHRNRPAYLRCRELGIPCRLDRGHLRFGATHQKLVSARVGGRLMAFCGGIDLAASRRDYPGHSLGGWHDVQLQLEGPACRDLDATFRERWNNLPPESVTDNLPPLPAAQGTAAGGPHQVQVLRTYAARNEYAFARAGEYSARAACLRAIGLAEEYIYIEDQFLTSQEIAVALQSRLVQCPKLRLIVLVPQAPHPALRPFNLRQAAIIQRLAEIAPHRFAIYHLRQTNPNRQSEQIYVHSKLMIIDDQWVEVGSLNLNRRSLTHDTEVCVAVVDLESVDRVDTLARNLRLALWSEHLALPAPELAGLDPAQGFALWQDRSELTQVAARPHTAALPPWSRALRPMWHLINRLTEGIIDPSGESA